MNVLINKLVQSVLQKDTLEQCSEQELQQLAIQYPYSDAIQLLLVKKLQVENSGLYKQQLQRASLHFQNSLWLDYLLNDTGKAEVINPEKEEKPVPIINELNEPAIIYPEAKEPEGINVSAEHTWVETPAPINTAPEITIPGKEEVITEIIKQDAPATVADEHKETEIKTPSFTIEPIDPSKTLLTFEPYHSVDYFASQGIKFKEEEKPKDKFGVQLKSFTDWLKAMKRLPAAEVTKTVTGNAEQKVEQMAEHSIKDREVITEAMAEVWEKQGNADRAIAIYSKLSLLDPPKSAYFAAKIEELKKTN